MVDVIDIYIDDSGTRHPDHKVGRLPAHTYDWFAMGGIMLDQYYKNILKERHGQFCQKWNITAPLHSVEIRAQSENFSFIRCLPKPDQDLFYEELYQLMASLNVCGIACVIDRPGYRHRYDPLYGRQKWSLCKTAFSVVIERAVKYAKQQNKKLRVFVERSDKTTDQKINDYYHDLKENGLPFDQTTSAIYQPLCPTDFKDTLYELRLSPKENRGLQLADLYLWPMCMGGYNPQVRPYKRLHDDGKLIDNIVSAEQVSTLGIKYSCFDLWKK